MSFRTIAKVFLGIDDYPKRLEKWGKITTIDINDVYDQFLHTTIHGHERQWVPFDILKLAERTNFNINVSTFHATPTGEIDLSDMIEFLCQAHPTEAFLIESARPCLTALLHAHARFPFSQAVPLTRDALLRAIILLTHCGGDFFRGDAITRSKRDYHHRLNFIFQALAGPDAGVGLVDHEAIVEVLERLPFPTHPFLTRMPKAPKGGFEGMAERLDPVAGASGVEPFVISGDQVEPLAALVVGLKKDRAAVTAVEVPLLEEKHHFIEWGHKIGVLRALEKLFEVLLQPGCEAKTG